LKNKKEKQNVVSLLTRGPERIRTAVAAFAELSLATRPQDRIYFRFLILDFRFEPEMLANIQFCLISLLIKEPSYEPHR
jgi:hypothetical protein